jgi:hypothetical protein
MADLYKRGEQEDWLKWAIEFIKRGIWPEEYITVHGPHPEADFMWGEKFLPRHQVMRANARLVDPRSPDPLEPAASPPNEPHTHPACRFARSRLWHESTVGGADPDSHGKHVNESILGG